MTAQIKAVFCQNFRRVMKFIDVDPVAAAMSLFEQTGYRSQDYVAQSDFPRKPWH